MRCTAVRRLSPDAGTPAPRAKLLVGALELCQEPQARIVPLDEFARLELPDGDLERAAGFLNEALALSRELVLTRETAFISHSLGQVELLRCRFDDARVHLEEATRLPEESGVRPILASALLGLAALEAARDLTDAVEEWRKAAAVLDEMGETWSPVDSAIEERHLEPLRLHVESGPPTRQ